MQSLEPVVRRLIVACRRKGMKVKEICNLFEVSAYTVWLWCTRAFHRGNETFEDMPRAPRNIEKKVTAPIENTILAIRAAFNWGTRRIQAVLESPPSYLLEFLAKFGFVTPIKLSRQTINNILKKHKINGSPYGKLHEWKFFRAEKPNEMWQLDLKGPIHMYGKRFFILVVLDDYSRFIVALRVYEGDPTTEDIVADLKVAIKEYGKPQKILTDNGSQFKEMWKEKLLDQVIEAVFAHPYYPRDKGKVERAIRNVNEELVRVVKYFAIPLQQITQQFKDWYNGKRYHQGVKGFPALIYAENISTSG